MQRQTERFDRNNIFELHEVVQHSPLNNSKWNTQTMATVQQKHLTQKILNILETEDRGDKNHQYSTIGRTLCSSCTHRVVLEDEHICCTAAVQFCTITLYSLVVVGTALELLYSLLQIKCAQHTGDAGLKNRGRKEEESTQE